MSSGSTATALGTVETHLDAEFGRNLEDLKALLRIPSVSADSRFAPDVRRAAEFVRSQMESAGLAARLEETPGNPVVVGTWRGAPGAPTVMVYGHYDVQPPDPLEKWTSPPFEPTERNGCLYARGATDDKGQMLTHVKSVGAWLRTAGKLPVNVLFVVEGEEEVGSRNLEDFLASHKEELRCDVAVVSDTSQYGDGLPAITYGLRGILACEVRVHGPNRDLHSGVFGGSVANPVNGLCRLIASLHDDRGRITVPGFYDDVVPLTAEERAAFAALPFDEKGYLQGLGVAAGWGEAEFSSTERRWARPTCDVNGIFGGYEGEGPKTIVPSQATAKITCRLVPHQSPEKLTAALEKHLRAHLLPGLRMEFVGQHGCEALVFATGGRFMRAARAAVARAFGREPVLIREGGSIPVVKTFRDVLGVDTLLLGWGRNTDNLHSPDEHFHLEDYRRGIRASAALWSELAAG